MAVTSSVASLREYQFTFWLPEPTLRLPRFGLPSWLKRAMSLAMDALRAEGPARHFAVDDTKASGSDATAASPDGTAPEDPDEGDGGDQGDSNYVPLSKKSLKALLDEGFSPPPRRKFEPEPKPKPAPKPAPKSDKDRKSVV